MKRAPSVRESINYVYVKMESKDKRAMTAKRVLIPSTIKALRLSCSEILKCKETIKCFYDHTGAILKDIKDLEPGTTIIASLKLPDGELEANDPNSPSKQPKFDPHAPLMFTKMPDTAPVPVARNPDCVVLGFPTPLVSDQADLSVKRRNPIKRSKMTVAHLDFAEEEEEKPENEQPRLHFFDQAAYSAMGTSVCTDSVTGRPKKFQKKSAEKTRLEVAKSLIGSLLHDSEAMSQLSTAMSQLSQDSQKFIGEADPDEHNHRQIWLNSIRSGIDDVKFCETLDGLHMSDAMRDRVVQSIVEHRFVSGGICVHRFNTAIVGPPKSGKSTLLQMYAEQMTVELMAAGSWKKSFVFMMNMKDYVPYIDSLDVFYTTFVQAICSQLMTQRLSAAKWIPSIQKYLVSLVRDPVHLLLSKSHMDSSSQRKTEERVKYLGELIKYVWISGISIDAFISMMLNLAIELPEILGFKKTILIIDNIEFSDVIIYGFHQFAGQDAYLSDHVKNLLLRSDYIVACENTCLFYRMMKPVDEYGIDLSKRIDILSTNGIVKRDPLPPVSVWFRREPRPFVIKESDCDGIPNYLQIWEELHRLVMEIDTHPENSDERDNAMYFACEHAQSLINLLFYNPEEEEVMPKVVKISKIVP